MEILNKYTRKYNVKISDKSVYPPRTYNCVVEAKRIVVTDTDITFFDYYNCVSGYFNKDSVIGYAIADD